MDPAVSRIRRTFADLHRRTWREEAARERGLQPSPMFPTLREEKYRSLFLKETRKLVQKAIEAESNPREREALSRLDIGLTDLYIDYTATRLGDKEDLRLYKAELRIDSATVDYLDTPHIVATGNSREWRNTVADHAHRWWARRIVPLEREAIRSKLARMARLAITRPLDYLQESMNLPFWLLRGVAHQFILGTQEAYEKIVLPHLRHRFGYDLRSVGDEQLEYVYGMHHFNQAISVDPHERTRDWLEGVLKFSLDGPGLRVRDLEERPKKSARAMCIPVDAPREVNLIIRPISSYANTESNLHEYLHALHALYTDPRLAFELRNLPRNLSVTETFAFLGHNALQEPDFVRWFLRVKSKVAEEIAIAAMIIDLLKLRIHSARLLFQFEFFRHPMNTVANQRAYVRLMRYAQPFEVKPFQYMMHAWSWEGADYLPAWLLSAHHRQRLWQRYGRRWFLQEELGRSSRKLFRRGESIGFHGLAYLLGSEDPWDTLPLIQHFQRGIELVERRKGN